MTFLIRRFNRYNLYYFANGKGGKSNDCIAKINCYIAGEKPWEKYLQTIYTSPVFTIKFFKDGSELQNEITFYPEDKEYSKGLIDKYGQVCRITLNYPISQFNDIISILRYENTPLYLFIEKGYKVNPKGGLLTEVPIDGNEYENIPIKNIPTTY